jgi:hypothetical protein
LGYADLIDIGSCSSHVDSLLKLREKDDAEIWKLGRILKVVLVLWKTKS